MVELLREKRFCKLFSHFAIEPNPAPNEHQTQAGKETSPRSKFFQTQFEFERSAANVLPNMTCVQLQLNSSQFRSKSSIDASRVGLAVAKQSCGFGDSLFFCISISAAAEVQQPQHDAQLAKLEHRCDGKHALFVFRQQKRDGVDDDVGSTSADQAITNRFRNETAKGLRKGTQRGRRARAVAKT